VTDHRSDLRVLALLDRLTRDWPTLTAEEARRELGVPAAPGAGRDGPAQDPAKIGRERGGEPLEITGNVGDGKPDCGSGGRGFEPR
jgi:hypothetical protein